MNSREQELPGPRGHRLVPHTADMGIEAWAEHPAGVFVEVANGLRDMLFGPDTYARTQTVTVTLSAGDAPELLVTWLNEILFRFEVDGLVPAAFTIERLNTADLQASIHGTPYHPDQHPLEHQIKAVTYHQLTLQPCRHGWFARVYVDL